MDSLRNTWWVLPGYGVGLGGLALITYRTMRAMVSTSKSITVQVNSYGEQYLDLLSLALLWVVSIIGMWVLWSMMKRNANTEKNPSDSPAKDALRKPLESFGGVSFSFSHEPETMPVIPCKESEREDASEVFLADTQGTNRDFSFSVQIVSLPDCE
jgi:ABC-type nickel/cobalt efflux system permease component RcnA